jgi:hypothetical protein
MVKVPERPVWTFLKLLFFLLMSISAFGQKYSLGVKVSPLMNWSTFGDAEDRDKFSGGLTFGYAGGLFVSFPLKNDFDFFAEGAYSKKGRVVKSQNDTWTNTSEYRMIDLHMLLRKSYKFRLEKNVPAQWFLNIGPEVSYWLSGKGNIKVEGPGSDYTIVFDEPPTSDFTKMYMTDANRWLFGLAIGGGVKAPLGRNQHITTEVRFVSGHTYLGQRNTSHIEILTFEDTMKTNLKILYLNIAYSFDFDVKEGRMGKSTLDKKIKSKKGRRR